MINESKFSLRLKSIEHAIETKEAAKAAHQPYILFQPWDMLNDQYNVLYYPEGKYQKPTKYEQVSYAKAMEILNIYPGDLLCQISMGSCIDWLFTFHFKDGRHGYTGEQMDRLTRRYLADHPELETLLTTEGGKEMMETLSRLPQTSFIWLRNLQTEMGNVNQED